jgi:hypothetical protein
MRWVPILGQDDMFELVHEPVDDGHDFVAADDGERAARAEIVLQIDDDQCFGSHQPLLAHSLIAAAKLPCKSCGVNGFFAGWTTSKDGDATAMPKRRL